MTSPSVRGLLRSPIVVAPMAGGPSTPGLVIAAAQAGALGFLAAGYKRADAMVSEMAAVRAGTTEPFGVNVFVPGRPAADRDAVVGYTTALTSEAVEVGATLGAAEWDDDDWAGKIAALLADPPPIVSFTFGVPPVEVVAAFRDTGAVVAITVTQPDEAQAAAAAGADALCVQGFEAGAHRGTFANDDHPGQDNGLLSLIDQIARVTSLPQIAAGGIMGPAQVTAVLAAGAVAAQCGTAFLRGPESGASPIHKAALADARFPATAITRAFSGRRARSLVNRFVLEHPDAPAGYPEINNATRPLRAAATAIGDADRMSLWAGQGYRAATDRPAAEIVEILSSTPH